jgi:predicted Mrr-cat superfamily restriction endonuclease
MPIQPEQLAALMQEVEQEDPIDFADLPFAEDDMRQLVASHLCEMAASMENFSTEDKLMTLLAVSAKLVLENMVLHVQLLRRHGLPVGDNVDALLSRLRKGENGGDQ